MMKRAIVACVATLAFIAPLSHSSAQKLECGSLRGHAAIDACTRGIESGRYEGQDLANFYQNRGVEYLEQRNIERALSDLERSLKIYPNNPLALNNLGRVYLVKRDNERALMEFEKALKINPRYAFALANRGLVYERKGEIEKAIKDYDEALRLNPNLTVVRNARTKLLEQKR